ncbi:MAG: carboxypeptidase-like regulatory domain-containing protein, partial [Myxococcales bacterium]
MSLAWLKLDIVLGSLGKVAAAGLLLTTLGLGGCGDDPVKAGVAKGCTLNSDCNGGLVCSFGLCHQECEVTTDCPAGQRCVKTDDSNVCQLDDEAACHFKSDCQEPLVCAIDLQCRNQCQKDLDCLKGQQCADGVCAEPAEVTEEGGLKGAVGAGGEGGGGPGPSGGSSGNGGSGGTTGPGMGGDDAGGMSQGGMPTVEPCVPGGDCTVQGEPCQAGTIVCDAADKPVCMSLGDAEDGVECGTDKVCSSGACVTCKVGDDCQPDANNVCLAGTVSCANGPSCDAAGNAPAGTGSGTDQVCTSNGACVSCVQDGACTPSNVCHQGQQDCATGPNCIDTQLAGNEGASCMGNATYNFCTAGSCVACQNGNSCVPTNPCHKGTLNCATNPPTCNDSNANATDGLVCGTDKSCISGACLTNDRVLSVTSGAVPDAAVDNSFTSVTVHLVDGNGANVAGAAVTVTASAGAYAVASAATNASGNAQISGRVGRAVGTYKFTVSAPGATSVDFTVDAIAPAAKSIFTPVNVN